MEWNFQIIFGAILCVTSAFASTYYRAMAGNAYSQMIVSFANERKFTSEWIKTENTLLLVFPSTSPEELEPFNHYDEHLVRRLLVKDLGPSGTEVKLILRDRNVRASVTTMKDPYRISIDLFDKDYEQKRDPVTGLPMTGEPNASASPNESNLHLLAPSDSLDTQRSAAAKTPEPNSNGKKRLLQALPNEINSPNELNAALAKIEPGIGKAWTTYPLYIYRAQLAPYEGREAPSKDLNPLQAKAVNTSTAMADYASKLFDFGHEGRALLAYQNVLLKDPEVFEKDALHLWKFAESNLGQGNFLLAEGYYNTILDKHKSHPLAKYAQLRKLDVLAIKAIKQGDLNALAKLSTDLDSLKANASNELAAQILIRKAFWAKGAADQSNISNLPLIDEELQRSLQALLPNVESQRTAFLASTLIANRLVRPETAWEEGSAPWLANYFERFKGPATNAIRSDLSEKTKTRLNREIVDLFKAGKFANVVQLFSGLPQSMKSIRKTPETSWAIAESYRTLGQYPNAIPFFETAAEVPPSIEKFKAQFYLAHLAGNEAVKLDEAKGNQAEINSLRKKSEATDKGLLITWSKLKSDERSKIQTAMAAPLEENASSDLKMKAPPTILLERLSSLLTVNPPKISSPTATNAADTLGTFSPSAGTIRQLDELGKKFAELGMTTERRKAMELMRFIKPASIEQDKEALKIWSSQLGELAEERRKANEFLEAGELYTMLGEAGTNSETRAESLYKGGLLLYRAGKKQDALKALQAAKSDTNNLFYSKLATERLNQIETR